MPASILRLVQLGRETTWGTPVAATTRLMGVAADPTVDPDDAIEIVDEAGRLYPSLLVAQTYQAAKGTLPMTITYEDLPYLLAGIFGTVSPTGAGPYVYTYAAPLTTVPSPQFYTMEFGTTGNVYSVEGMAMTTLMIRGDPMGFWAGSVDFLGERIATDTFTSLSDRTVELAKMSDTSFRVDAIGGTMGATVVTATLIGFELEITTGRHLKTFAGSINPQSTGETKWGGTLKTVLEFNASAKAYFDALITPGLVQRQIEIRATSGVKLIQLQFAGHISEPPVLWGDRDGNMTIEVTWGGEYNTTFGNWLKAIVTNNVAALP